MFLRELIVYVIAACTGLSPLCCILTVRLDVSFI